MAQQEDSIPARTQQQQPPAGSRKNKKMAPRSRVWEFFDRFTDGHGKAKADCKRCHLVLGADTTSGTSTLLAHVRRCWGDEAARAPRPPLPSTTAPPSRSHGSSSSGTPEAVGLHLRDDKEVSEDLARMIALHGYNPSFVEDGYIRSFVRKLNPAFQVPSRVAIEEMCDGIFDEARRDLLDRLENCPGRVSLAVGEAKTPEAGEVLYIACHFIDEEWKLHKLVLDALMPEGPRYLEDAGPILGFRVVNAAADCVIDFVSEHVERLSVVAYGITDHDVHRALKNYIQVTNSGRKNLNWTTTIFVDNVLHSIARYLFPDSEFTSNMYDDMMGLNLTRQERLRLLSELDLDYEWAYDECWCACYYSLEILGKRGCGFLGAELFVKLLCKVWKQVYRAIQRISASAARPTSNLCLAELLKLREILQPELARFSGDTADVHDGYDKFCCGNTGDVLTRASNILDKAIQDSYLVLSVPLALDPRYKLSYIEFCFKRAFGSEAGKYISEVTTKIKDLYDAYIKEYGTISSADHSDGANAMMATTSSDPMEQAWIEHRRSQDVMATLVNSSNTETQTELNHYLQDRFAPATKDFDVLQWWKNHNSEYPMLAWMTRDALAMPTCCKLSSDQIAQVRSLLRGYSKKSYESFRLWLL